MQPLSNFYKLLSENEIEMLHENVLKLLENPGIKIENKALLEALKNKGASVDFTGEIAKIPKKLVEEVIEIESGDDDVFILKTYKDPDSVSDGIQKKVKVEKVVEEEKIAKPVKETAKKGLSKE